MNFKNFLPILAALVLLAGCASTKGKQNEKDAYDWFPFSWYAATISGKYFDKVAILVPAKMNDLKANFTLQFDLGSNTTCVYGNVIKSYYSDPELQTLLNGSSKSSNDGGGVVYNTSNFIYRLSKFSINQMSYLENYGDAIPKDSLYTQTEKHIGTLGADVFKNKILIIDYPNQRMCILDSLTRYWKKHTTFVEAQLQRDRLHIPLTLKGKVHWFLFNTGASLFPINTNKEFWSAIVDNSAPTDTIVANSWGEKVSFYGRPIKEKVYLGKRLLNPSKAWYNENKRLLEFNRTEKIEGTSGNAYFFNNTVVLDFKNKKFGIVD